MKNKFKKIIANPDWTFVYSEANSLIVNDIFFRGFTDYKSIPGMFNILLYENRGGVHVCKAPLSELDRIREEGKVFLKKKYRDKFSRNISNCVKSFEALYKEYKKIDLKNATNKAILSLFEKYTKQLELMFAYYQVSGGRCYPLLETYTKQNLRKYFREDELEDVYGLLLKNIETDSLEWEDLELHSMSERLNISDRLLIIHSEKYPLLFINMYDTNKIIKSLRNRLKKYRHGKETFKDHRKKIILSKKDIKLRQKKLYKLFKKDKDLLDCIEYLREQGRIRFEYKNWKNGAEYRFLGLFAEIAKRINIPIEEMMLTYLVKDIQDFLKSGQHVSKEERINKKKISVFYQSERGKIFTSSDRALDLIASVINKKDIEIKS